MAASGRCEEEQELIDHVFNLSTKQRVNWKWFKAVNS